MNQVVTLFQESNIRMKRLMKSLEGVNKPDMDVIASTQREFEGQIKLLNTVVSAYGIASKNKRALKDLSNMNIMDDSTAIDIGIGYDNDKVKCPESNKLITRDECLDLSGAHFEECSGCEIGKATKDKLLPPRSA